MQSPANTTGGTPDNASTNTTSGTFESSSGTGRGFGDTGSTGGTSGSSGGMREELRSDVEQVTTSASNRLHSELDSRKGTAATQVRSVSTAIDRAAGELDDESPEWIKSAFRQAATQVQRFADTLEQKDSRQIIDQVKTLARDNPGTFLFGCAALGFAAARIFKAGASEGTGYPTGQRQFPPVQVEEPMFRPSGSETTPSPSTAGEFV